MSASARAATDRGSEEDFDRLEQFLDAQGAGHCRESLTEHRAILASMRSRNATLVQRPVLAYVSADRFDQDLQLRPGRAGAAGGPA